MTQSKYPRSLAVHVLTRVLSQKEPLDEVLLSLASEAEVISPVTYAWLQEVTSGTLRWKGRLDSILDSYAEKKKPSGWLRKILLVALYQLIVQDRTPASFVVSETVDEIKVREGIAPSRFANALLRKVSNQALAWREQPFHETFSEKEAAQWSSLPEWLWRRLKKAHSLDWAHRFAKASLERPHLWIRTKKEEDEGEFALNSSASLSALPDSSSSSSFSGSEPLSALKKLGVKGDVPHSFRVEETKAIRDLPGFREGLFFVQDVSSQFLLYEVDSFLRENGLGDSPAVSLIETKENVKRIDSKEKASLLSRPIRALDVCAAPGGKAASMAWSGYQVYAADRSQNRRQLLEETIKRVAPTIELLHWDDVDSYLRKTGQDALDLVWIDAPCTGSGIIRRHPDVRWLREEKDLLSLMKEQRSLIKRIWDQLPDHCFLVYSVCSVLSEEGRDVISDLGLNAYQKKDWLLSPHEAPHGDGFFGAILQKGAKVWA